MQEIERFFGNLFRGIINRFTNDAVTAAERKVRDTVNQQIEQLQKPKRKDQDDRE